MSRVFCQHTEVRLVHTLAVALKCLIRLGCLAQRPTVYTATTANSIAQDNQPANPCSRFDHLRARDAHVTTGYYMTPRAHRAARCALDDSNIVFGSSCTKSPCRKEILAPYPQTPPSLHKLSQPWRPSLILRFHSPTSTLFTLCTCKSQRVEPGNKAGKWSLGNGAWE